MLMYSYVFSYDIDGIKLVPAYSNPSQISITCSASTLVHASVWYWQLSLYSLYCTCNCKVYSQHIVANVQYLSVSTATGVSGYVRVSLAGN
jgi:hypothetical protein